MPGPDDPPVEPPAPEPVAFRRRLARNTAASIAANGWTMVLALVTLPVVLAGLGTAPFGVWTLIQTFSATNGWLSVTSVGMAVASGRLVAAADGRTGLGRAIGACLGVFGGMGAVTGLGVVLAGPVLVEAVLDVPDGLGSSARTALALFGAQTFLEHLVIGGIAVLEGAQRVDLGRLCDAIRKTAVAVAVCTAATVDGDLVAVAFASAVATAAGGLAVAVAVLRLRLPIRSPVRRDVVAVLRYSTTMSALTASGVLHRTMDRLIAGAAFGAPAVALVEIANQVQIGCTAPLAATTYPVLSSAPWLQARGDQSALASLVSRATAYSAALTLPLVATVVVLAGPFVRLWVGDDFAEAIGLTQLAVLHVALVAPLQAGQNALQGLGLGRQVLVASLLTVAANLVASLVLVEVVGLAGVFLGTLLGSALLLPILGRAVTRATGYSPGAAAAAMGRALVPSAAAALASGAALVVAPSDGAALVVGGPLAVLAGFVAWRASVPVDERKELAGALRSRTAPPS